MHWLPHAASGLVRAARVRWWTRHGFVVTDEPAFSPEAVAWFREAIAGCRHYIEFGSGASTLLAARAGARTISMEADPRYAAAVRAALPAGAPVTVLDARIGLTAEWSFPVFTRPTPDRLARWRNYAVEPLSRAADEGWTPQLILVDGRFRVACALHSAASMASAGRQCDLLFDDYRHRPYYHCVEAHLGKPKLIGTSALFQLGPGSASAGANLTPELLSESARDWR